MSNLAIAYLLFCIGALIYSPKMENEVYRRCFQISAMSSIILYAFYFAILFFTGKL